MIEGTLKSVPFFYLLKIKSKLSFFVKKKHRLNRRCFYQSDPAGVEDPDKVPCSGYKHQPLLRRDLVLFYLLKIKSKLSFFVKKKHRLNRRCFYQSDPAGILTQNRWSRNPVLYTVELRSHFQLFSVNLTISYHLHRF